MVKYSICVSGAASGETVNFACSKAYEVGAEIAKQGHITTTGATVGLPFFAARGASDQGGTSIGFSPANGLREHIRKYRLPVGVYDYINFTGMDYVGRDVHLVQSSDAVITIGGRIGSLHEFTTAIESRKPCGVLLGSGGTADLVQGLIETLEEPSGTRIVYDTDPVKLVHKVIKLMDVEYADISKAALKEYEKVFEALTCDADLKNPKRSG